MLEISSGISTYFWGYLVKEFDYCTRRDLELAINTLRELGLIRTS